MPLSDSSLLFHPGGEKAPCYLIPSRSTLIRLQSVLYNSVLLQINYIHREQHKKNILLLSTHDVLAAPDTDCLLALDFWALLTFQTAYFSLKSYHHLIVSCCGAKRCQEKLTGLFPWQPVFLEPTPSQSCGWVGEQCWKTAGWDAILSQWLKLIPSILNTSLWFLWLQADCKQFAWKAQTCL